MTIAPFFKKAHAPMRWPGAFNVVAPPGVHTRKLPRSLVHTAREGTVVMSYHQTRVQPE